MPVESGKKTQRGDRPAQTGEVKVTDRTQVVVLNPDLTVAKVIDSGNDRPRRVDAIVVQEDRLYLQSQRQVRVCDDGGCRHWPWPSALAKLDGFVSAIAGYGDHGLTLAKTECDFHGALTVVDAQDPASDTATLGQSDTPRLAGPTYPLRVAADADVSLIEGPHVPGPDNNTLVHPAQKSGAQRRTGDGVLLSSRSICTYGSPDVALVGDDQYVAWGRVHQKGSVLRYAEGPTELWRASIGGPGPWRIGATDDHVAVLAVGAERVDVLDAATGARKTQVDLKELDTSMMAIDIAIDNEAIYLADVVLQRVVVLSLGGEQLGAFDLHDPPRSIAAGAEGTVFVLGANGWGLRYGRDGGLETQWHMPPGWKQGKLEATDLAVSREGNVLVPFVGARPAEHTAGTQITDSGVWVFAPNNRAPEATPGSPIVSCLAAADKQAFPRRLELGASTEVQLRVEGTCPGTTKPHQVMFVFDTSGSMADVGLMDRARQWAMAAAGFIRPGEGQVGLAGFNDEASLLVPLSDDVGAVIGHMARLSPHGDTFLVQGIKAARDELSGVRGNPDSLRSILIITDGDLHDWPEDMLQAARDDGVQLRLLVFPGAKPMSAIDDRLRQLFADSERVPEPMTSDIQVVMDPLRGWTEPDQLFEHVTIEDELPVNMELVPVSARPEPAIAGRVLRWEFDRVAAGGAVTASYRIKPLASGVHPVSLGASARFTDGLGVAGVAQFPVPVVEVILPPTATPTPVPSPVYLPRLDRGVKMPFPDYELAERIWRAMERYVAAWPPEELMRAWDQPPSATAAQRTVEATCAGFPEETPPVGPGERVSCMQSVSECLALFHALRWQRTAQPADLAWARSYHTVALHYLSRLVYGPEDAPSGLGYRDKRVAVTQNPERVVLAAIVTDVLERESALDNDARDRARELLSGVARAWMAQVWSTGIQPSSGVTMTTLNAPHATASSLAGRQVVSTQPWSYAWDADHGASPAYESARMGAGIMLSSRVLASALDDDELEQVYAAGRHFVDFALVFDRPDDTRGDLVRTLNGTTEGGPYGKRRMWIEDLEPDVPSPAHMGSAWQHIGTALFAADDGAQLPWASLVPDDAHWRVMLASAEETLHAPDGTYLVDTASGGGFGYNVGAFPDWVSPCGSYLPGRNFVDTGARPGGGPRYVSTLGYPAGIAVLAAGWPIMRVGMVQGDWDSYALWRRRMLSVLDEYEERPPSPRLAKCKVAPYVSNSAAYHGVRMLQTYVLAYMGASGYHMQPWGP